MIESILSSGILGFITAPILSLIKGTEERKKQKLDMEQMKIELAHELKMMDLQAQYTKELQQMRLAEVEVKSDSAIMNSMVMVDLERQKNLFSGNKIIDAFTSSVRPMITYLFTFIFLFIFTFYGYTVISQSSTTMDGFELFFDSPFTQGMSYLYANIITFWFGQRLLDRNPRIK